MRRYSRIRQASRRSQSAPSASRALPCAPRDAAVEDVEQISAVRGHEHAGGLLDVGRRVRGALEQAGQQAARPGERGLELCRDGGIVTGGVVDRAQERAVLGEGRDQTGDHRLHHGAGVLLLDALHLVHERVVGVGQEIGCERRQVVPVAVEDRARHAGARHHRTDAELGEGPFLEQPARRVEDQAARLDGRDVRTRGPVRKVLTLCRNCARFATHRRSFRRSLLMSAVASPPAELARTLALPGGRALSYALLGAPQGPTVVVLDGPGSRGLARAASQAATERGIRRWHPTARGSSARRRFPGARSSTGPPITRRCSTHWPSSVALAFCEARIERLALAMETLAGRAVDAG